MRPMAVLCRADGAVPALACIGIAPVLRAAGALMSDALRQGPALLPFWQGPRDWLGRPAKGAA
jgi:hypothetical protein